MEVPQQTPRPPPSAALFREIHKNAWLKRLPPLAGDSGKLLAVGQKKNSCERWWIVFCVHDDASAYLEAYNDAAHATTHVPKWRSALANALHVTGSIRPLGRGEYEFVVALREEAVRLVAPSREVMQDWVDTLRNKLREMKILSPRENVYSKPPEQIKARAPTRDPNSPLPAPPPGPIVRVPGIEEPLRISDTPADITVGESSSNIDEGISTDNSVSNLSDDSAIANINVDTNTIQASRIVNEQVRISSSKKSKIQLIPGDNTSAENVASCSADTVVPRTVGEGSGTQINRNSVNDPVRVSVSKRSKIHLTAIDNNAFESDSTSDSVNRNDILGESSGTQTNQSLLNEVKLLKTPKRQAKSLDSDASRIHVESDTWDKENVTIVNKDVPEITATHGTDVLSNTDNFNVILNVASKNDNLKLTNQLIDLDFDVMNSKDNFNMCSGNLDEFLTSQIPNSDDNMWVDEDVIGPSSSGVMDVNRKKKAHMAKVSGMNVCLVKSVLMERYLDSDGFDDDEGSGCEDVQNIVELAPGEAVKAKYSQVNLKEKKTTKENRLLKMEKSNKPNVAMDKSKVAEVESIFPKNIIKPIKPAILPRTVMNVKCDEVRNEDTVVRSIKPIVLERKKILLNRTSSVPDAVGTEELLQSYSGQMVEDSTASNLQPSSNVTIITLSEPHTAIPLLDKNVFNFDSTHVTKTFELGHGRSVSDTKSEDIAVNSDEISFQDDLNLLKNRLFPSNRKSAEKPDYETCFTRVDSKNSKKINIMDKNSICKRNSDDSLPIIVSNAASYVNVTTADSDTNVFVSGNNSVTFDGDAVNSETVVLRNASGRKFEAISNVSMSVGSGYGHIRHSTTVESKPDDGSCDLNQNISNTSIKKTSLDGKIQSFEENASVLDKAVENISKNDKVTILNGVTLLKNDVNLPSSSNNGQKMTEVDFIKLSDDLNKSRRKSESQISTVNVVEQNVTVKLNAAPQRRPQDDLYESVFTPFSVITKQNTVKLGSSKANLGRTQETAEADVMLGGNSQASDISSVNIVTNSENPLQNNATRTENGDYEYLSWVRTDNNALRSNNPVQNSRTKKDSVKKTNDSNIESHNQKSNIFTRGLTELSFVSRFKNNFIIGNQNSTNKNANSPSSQFYIDQSEQGTSSSVTTCNMNNNNSKGVNEKKNGGFGGRLNAIFGRLNQEGVSRGRDGGTSGGTRVENSSLRRNWSEHNDRTAPVPILRSKPLRPRPPLLEGQTSSILINQNTSQERDGDVRQMRRRSSSLSSARCSIDDSANITSETESPLSSTALNNITGIISPDVLSSHTSQPNQRPLSLRSQQVCRLRREMTHSAGVRLRLRARDCPGEAVALVDAYGAVWVAGWKQRSHPLLYNALHIGDRLAAVGGVAVSCARQARKALGDTPNGAQFVELIIKRLPHGRVYALRKDADIQDLGLILDSATVVGIIPNSPASKSMVPSGGTLTEVNGRPLNLLLKKGDSQVKDRLNSIGKDVSILLQPTEFVSLLRTALKAVRGHKDYIVQ